MKWTSLIPAVWVAALLTSCSETTAPVVQPVESSKHEMFSVGIVPPSKCKAVGTVLVHVHWDGQGLAGKRVELLELHRALTTDEEGFAKFVVPVGDYTLRAYEINRGGPAMLYVDTKVTVVRNQVLRVEIVDCLPCV